MPSGTLTKFIGAFLLIFGSILCGYYGMSVMNQHKMNRMLASHNPDMDWKPLPIGKHLAMVRTQILQPESIPDSDTQELELTAYATIQQPTNEDLQYRWILPEGVRVVDGIEADAWSGILVNQTAVSKITVTGFSHEQGKIIAFEAYTVMGNKHMGSTSVINSRPEDTMESIAVDKMKSRQDYDQQK